MSRLAFARSCVGDNFDLGHRRTKKLFLSLSCSARHSSSARCASSGLSAAARHVVESLAAVRCEALLFKLIEHQLMIKAMGQLAL